MRKVRVLFLALIMGLMFISVSLAKEIAPIVSTDWLEKNLSNPKLVVIDIRKAEDYKNGHIPGAVNVFYGVWAVDKKGLKNELPEDDDLVDIINGAGISNDSIVVIAGPADSVSDVVNMTRVVLTLKYAGFNNSAVLDGGINKWLKEQRATSTEIVKPKAGNFKPNWNKGVLVGKDYVAKQLGKAIIIDDRGSDAFYGVTKLDFVEKAGHIKGAKNLPTSWLYGKDNVYRSAEEMQAIAEGVVGKDKKKEIISYCDTGKVSTGWWFVLSEVLGYENVKVYEGSMQEWSKDPNLPVVRYSWE
ncbi:MAG: rhodanese-like domain-containing protein [Proteobacteria bacterium]|nr:rhodanese-like domain-containing protein [Pseudomonadota bacterium]